MRRLWVPLLLVFTVLIGGAGVFVAMFVRGTAGVDAWAVGQVVRIVNTYLVPDIEFDSFSFSLPGTITLRGVSLVGPDGTRVAGARELRVVLTERPHRGRPIAIERIHIIRGDLRLIREDTAEGPGFKGLVPFVHQSAVREQDQMPADVRLSNVLRIRRLELGGGSIVYEAGEGQPPMELSGLNINLDVDPGDDAAEPGWYRLNTVIGRAPLFVLAVDGRLNIDTLIAQIDDLKLDLSLNEEARRSLPPQLQTLLASHAARGSLFTRARGVIPLLDWKAGEVGAEITLEEVNFAAGEGRLPITSGNAEIAMSEGAAHLSRVELQTLGGSLRADLHVDLNVPEMPFELNWQVYGVELREALRVQAPPDQPPKLAGVVTSAGRITSKLKNFRATLDGRGRATVTKGRLVNIPLVSALARSLNVVNRLRGGGGLTDEAEADFTLRPDAVRLESFSTITSALAARGSGLIYYDGRLDLSVNAGPLERVQALLGRIGDAFGAITDRLVTYRVRGTLKDPTVTVQPLGIGN